MAAAVLVEGAEILEGIGEGVPLEGRVKYRIGWLYSDYSVYSVYSVYSIMHYVFYFHLEQYALTFLLILSERQKFTPFLIL